MLRDPATGRIPDNIRTKELSFARTLPAKRPGLLKGLATDNAVVVSWSSRGPVNVGGRTRALALDVTNPQIILAGGASGGMWRSIDGGLSWQKRTVQEGMQSVSCIVQDRRPGRTSTWYYGTGELRGNSAAGGGGSLYRGDGIYRSTDNGVTWTRLASTATNNVLFDQPFDYVWNLALSPADTSVSRLVAATIGGIQSSTNGGTSWTTTIGTLAGNAGPRYTDVVVTTTGVFYATCSSRNINTALTSTGAGIYRSTDGISWTAITPAGWPADYNRIVIAVAPSDPNTVYFMGEAPNVVPTGHVFWKYTYISGNGSGGGGVWVDRSANLPDESAVSGAKDGNARFGSQTSYDLTMAVHPTNPNTVFVGAINLYRTTDAFATSLNWTRIGGYAGPTTYARYAQNHPDHHALVFHPTNSNLLYNGNDGGVFATSGPLASFVSWTPLNNGFVTTQFYTIALDHATTGDMTALGGMQDNGTWYTSDADAFNPWLEIASGDGGFCAIEGGGDATYVSTQSPGPIYRLTPTTQGRIDPSGWSAGLFINPFILDPANEDRMYVGGGTTIWRCDKLSTLPMGSSNAATTGWVNLTKTSSSGATITALGASKTPANVLYYGTSNGRVYRIDNAVAADPQPIDVSVGKGFPAAAYVTSIAVDPLDATKALLAFSNYTVRSLFWTTNGGQTWTDVSANLEESSDGSGNGPSVRWVSILPDTTATWYFAGTSTGLYSSRSLNGGSTVWSQEGPSEVSTNVVTMMDVRTRDGMVVVGTHGGGVFSATIPVVPPTPPPPAVVPSTLRLSANYPNPFNAGTQVLIDLPRTAMVTVRIVDITGRIIAIPVNGTMAAGARIPVRWDGRNQRGEAVASGVYIIQVESGGTIRSQKMLLIR